MTVVLDPSGVSFLAGWSGPARVVASRLQREGDWPPRVPTAVLVECLTGNARRDVAANRLLQTCDIERAPSESLARRAALLRMQARRGSAVDALVVAAAEPDGVVLTSDLGDLTALAVHAHGVRIARV